MSKAMALPLGAVETSVRSSGYSSPIRKWSQPTSGLVLDQHLPLRRPSRNQPGPKRRFSIFFSSMPQHDFTTTWRGTAL
jgi:hypothetical protein